MFVTSLSLSFPICKVGLCRCLPPGALGKSEGSDTKQVPGMWGASEPLLCLLGDVQLLLLPSELALPPLQPPALHPLPLPEHSPSISLSYSSSLRSPASASKLQAVSRDVFLFADLIISLLVQWFS